MYGIFGWQLAGAEVESAGTYAVNTAAV